MPLMEALNKSCLYNGRNYKPGERFEMDNAKHVEMFVGWGKAKIVHDAPNVQTEAPQIESRNMKAETEEDSAAVAEQRKKRIYKRRDMRPEE